MRLILLYPEYILWLWQTDKKSEKDAVSSLSNVGKKDDDFIGLTSCSCTTANHCLLNILLLLETVYFRPKCLID